MLARPAPGIGIPVYPFSGPNRVDSGMSVKPCPYRRTCSCSL